MLATSGPVHDEPGWAFEWKYDGVRTIAAVRRGQMRLYSRRLGDVTASYPELAALTGKTRRPLLLDGEIVALDEQVRPSFGLLQQRMNLARPSRARIERIPVVFFPFDLLQSGTRSCLTLPYLDRRERMAALDLDCPEVRVRRHFLAEDIDGAALLDTARQAGLEGLVSKRLNSPYRPGIRSTDWIKTPLTRTQEVVIAGWTPGQGRRTGLLGALLLGVYDEQARLVYVGHVGTGFTDRALREMHARLTPLAQATSPYAVPVRREYARTAQWVDPVLAGEVEYREWTTDGRLRAPSWRGLRPDRDPTTIHRADG
ncbi:DNA ligase [Amycolatopsis sp. K13G38]|uniref:DNA ligase (ATP) n=2 Tax=Amycolatopsis acididurans TaxID=2724524 RepID=A0ABX1JCD4_9PSEU|nr:DNA ligase [Amycolatopsis acididurans]